jgi:hypothetical protein
MAHFYVLMWIFVPSEHGVPFRCGDSSELSTAAGCNSKRNATDLPVSRGVSIRTENKITPEEGKSDRPSHRLR